MFSNNSLFSDLNFELSCFLYGSVDATERGLLKLSKIMPVELSSPGASAQGQSTEENS